MVFLVLLLFVAGFALVARWLQISYPIVLVVAGLLVSFVPHVPRIPLNPNMVFLIFLPPLLYSSAWGTSWREFRYNAVTIGFLAVGLVAFTVWGVSEFADRFITAMDWKSGFVLGAVVAATDAIAATSIAKSLGLPRRIVDILEGESLLNDATGLLALEFGIRILTGGETPTLGAAVLRLLYLTIVGTVVGLLIGFIVSKISGLIDDDGPLEIVLSLLAPYTAYLAGDALHASGVFSVVVCGLYVSRKSSTLFSPGARLQILAVWEALTFILNGIVFVLIGLQMPFVLAAIRGQYSWGTLVLYGSAFSGVLIVLRLVWIFPASWVANVVNRKLLGHKESWGGAKNIFVVGWTGMRGVLALAAAISLPETMKDGRSLENRDLIEFLAFSVILVTLVVQGLTLPPLIRWLGLAKPEGMEEEEREARRMGLGAAIETLKKGKDADGDRFEHVYEDLLHRYQHRLAAVGGVEGSEQMDAATYKRLREIAAGAVRAERREAIRMRDEGRISDDTLRKLEREMDLQEIRYLGAGE
ncbi:sodium/proton antiporter, CPA1 family [Granulicella pectinivorans]|jgi:CPA1 family monovalent cation:H+ antiporter|uniref:Sodium/proton antiporter, CPA1 family n=2 Tax=Granulicella pectinivorans TaxID=474950 RepID=A0A1I6MCZ8_9BACT|nr:sodium/proton antiporter, CPA1 family [Granulicella pectinivorans]